MGKRNLFKNEAGILFLYIIMKFYYWYVKEMSEEEQLFL
jgi:hypothetical protein